MARREILAEQHFASSASGSALGAGKRRGSPEARQKKERGSALPPLPSGKTPVAIGTHALFQKRSVPLVGLAW